MKFKFIKVNNLKVNCIILWCVKTLNAIIVDPGGAYSEIIYFISQNNLKIIKIIITHCHIDHFYLAYDFALYYKVLIYGPSIEDKVLFENNIFQNTILPICNYIQPVIIWTLDKMKIYISSDLYFTVIHCPGHTPGHIILYNSKYKFLITGDVLFKNFIGRTDLLGGNYIQLINSIITRILVLDYNVLFIPGHGIMSCIKHELIYNKYIKFFIDKKD